MHAVVEVPPVEVGGEEGVVELVVELCEDFEIGLRGGGSSSNSTSNSLPITPRRMKKKEASPVRLRIITLKDKRVLHIMIRKGDTHRDYYYEKVGSNREFQLAFGGTGQVMR